MVWARKGWLAVLFGSVLSTMGCCYHAAHFGKERDIGIGRIGCGSTCQSRCGCQPYDSCAACTPHAPGGLPASVRGTGGIIGASYEPDMQTGDPTGFRKAERPGSEFPIYVLPQDSISNAMLVSPSPLPAFAPRPKEVR